MSRINENFIKELNILSRKYNLVVYGGDYSSETYIKKLNEDSIPFSIEWDKEIEEYQCY